jgi:hypothetical protein
MSSFGGGGGRATASGAQQDNGYARYKPSDKRCYRYGYKYTFHRITSRFFGEIQLASAGCVNANDTQKLG